jgi:hypothetical protein
VGRYERKQSEYGDPHKDGLRGRGSKVRNLEKDPLLRNERFSPEQKAYARERGLLDD